MFFHFFASFVGGLKKEKEKSFYFSLA